MMNVIDSKGLIRTNLDNLNYFPGTSIDFTVVSALVHAGIIVHIIMTSHGHQ